MNTPQMPPMGMPPGGQQIKISPEQLMGMVAMDLFASQCKAKEMTIVKALPDYEEAISTWHSDTNRKYGLRHIKNEQKIIFDLWVPIEGSNEAQHREMLATYQEILGIMVQNRLSTPMQAADAMYQTMNERTVQEWESIIEKMNSKSSIIIP